MSARGFEFAPESGGLPMANEQMYSSLPSRDPDEAIAFYEALGSSGRTDRCAPTRTPWWPVGKCRCACSGMLDFAPARSYGSVIIVVPDPDALYRAFAAGVRHPAHLRHPRIRRPRKRFGTVYGFSVVDVGGNWLRVSKAGPRRTKLEPG